MSIGIFTDKLHPPAVQDVTAALGSKFTMWEEMIRFVYENYRSQGEFKFYGKNYGWALRFRKGSKALLSLYPNAEGFAAQIILGEPEVEAARALKLGKKIWETIQAAHPYPEGRWLFINVKTNKDLKDVQQLLRLKAPPGQKK